MHARLTILIMVAVVGCNRTEHNQTVTAESTHLAVTDTSVASSTPRENAKPIGGPRILVDSSAQDASLEKTSNEYVVHIPSKMARLLYDSLPGFTPYQQSAYSPRLVHDSALSVVIGDFDGDSRRDVAMVGTSATKPALFMLLARSDSTAEPRIVFILPPTPPDPGPYMLGYVARGRIKSPDNPKFVLELRTDAIHLLSEVVSEICYLDRGTMRSLGVAGD